MTLGALDRYREVYARYSNEAPVKLGALANDLGISVVLSDLPTGISGKLQRDPHDNEKWIIRINRHEHRNRQRFTLAHEIAHFVLHRTSISEELNGELIDDTFYRSGLSDRREREANQLAAEMLMPWPLIRKLTAEGVRTPRELAERLGVSEAAMSIRLGLPT